MPRKRIAVVATVYRYLSHAQHFADRFLVGYPYGGQWHHPEIDIVSLYVDQKPEGDQSEDRAHRIGQTFKVSYIDLVAPNTIDELILNSLDGKRDLSKEIMGDNIKRYFD